MELFKAPLQLSRYMFLTRPYLCFLFKDYITETSSFQVKYELLNWWGLTRQTWHCIAAFSLFLGHGVSNRVLKVTCVGVQIAALLTTLPQEVWHWSVYSKSGMFWSVNTTERQKFWFKTNTLPISAELGESLRVWSQSSLQSKFQASRGSETVSRKGGFWFWFWL